MFIVEFVKAANTYDLARGDKIKVNLEGQDILLINIEGSYYAIQNKCPHMGGSLYNGKLEGSNITCPKHGSVFDATSGKVVEAGTMFSFKVKVRDLKSFPVRIEGTDILLGMD
jgi:3-phenylpropionate/trans-cinnamate dioxygenase ferredoxin subunit